MNLDANAKVDLEKASFSTTPAVDFWLSEAPLTTVAEQELDRQEEVTLLELLDKLLTKGVVVTGDITLSVAGVDLLYIGLRVMLTTAQKAVDVGAVKLKNGRIV